MSGLVTWERLEQLSGIGHYKREEQPVWLGGRQCGLHGGRGGVTIPHLQVRDASEQMRFNERERRAGHGRSVQDISKYVQRTGGVSLRHGDNCARVVNETHPTGFGREPG